MRALVKTGRSRAAMELREYPRPVPGPAEVVIRVRATGICGSDLHIYRGELECKTPIVLGHEFSGELAEIGRAVTGWGSGDPVVSELHVGACGNCYYCTHDLIHLCPAKTPLGWAADGSFAEYVKVPARLLHRIPAGVSFHTAALAEPLAVVVYAVLERSNLSKGDRVAVIGAGPIGLLAALVCKVAGASWVGIIGRRRRGALRLQVANELGLNGVIDSSHEDPISVINSATEGVGADVVVEAAGTEDAVALALGVLRRGGSLVALGMTATDTIAFPWNEAIKGVCDIVFSWSSTRSSWDTALAIMQRAGKEIDKLVTHEIPLADWERGFRLVEDRQAIKCLLIP